MISPVRLSSIALICAALTCKVGKSELILTLESAQITSTTVIAEVDVYLRWSGAVPESFLGLTLDFAISAGQFDLTPGVLGQEGMIGFGNLNSTSTFIRNDNRSLSLSLDFNAEQPILTTDAILATLRIDPSGLADGFYAVSVVDSLADGLNPIIFSNPPGTGGFEIRAVPEPNSMTIFVLVSAVWLRNRRSRSTLASLS